MTWSDIAAMTNEGGRKFLSWVQPHWEVLGTTERGARTGEFFVIYRIEKQYRLFCLSKSNEKNNGSCCYGSVRHYSLQLQRQAAIERGESPNIYCGKTEKEIELWMEREFGVPILAHWIN